MATMVRDQKLIGGIHPVKDAENSLEIKEFAQFAVDDYNKKQNAKLEFKKVKSAKEQLVAGTIYYIKLVAADGEKEQVYEANVLDQPWKNVKEVLEFKLIGKA